MKKGYFLVLLAASMWGTLGIFAKLLYGFNLDPFTIIFYRATIAFLILLIYNTIKGLEVKKERLPFYVTYGFFTVSLFYSVYFHAVKVSSVSLAVLLLYTAPIYSTILGYLIFKEKITKMKTMSLTMVIFGIVLVTQINGRINLLGVILGLLSGLTYALYGIFGKIAMQNDEPQEALLYTIGFGALFLMPFSKFSVPIEALPYLFALAFFPTFLAYLLYNRALKEVEASKASIIATVEPVVALILAYLIFGETLTGKQLLGAFLIILGAIILQSEDRIRKFDGDDSLKL